MSRRQQRSTFQTLSYTAQPRKFALLTIPNGTKAKDDVVVEVRVADLRKKRLPVTFPNIVTLLVTQLDGPTPIHYAWTASAENTGDHQWSGEGVVEVVDHNVAASRAWKFIFAEED